MKKFFCDVCGREVEEEKLNVIRMMSYDTYRSGIGRSDMKEVCPTCLEKIKGFRVINKLPPDFEERKEETRPSSGQQDDFWETHDPSGGDLPGPESEMDEGYLTRTKAALEAKRQQASKEKPKRQLVDYGKVWALRNAGWKARQIAEEMKISEATVWNACKKMRAMKEMEGSKEGEI